MQELWVTKRKKQHPAYYYTPEQRRSKNDWKVLYLSWLEGEFYSSFYLGGCGVWPSPIYLTNHTSRVRCVMVVTRKTRGKYDRVTLHCANMHFMHFFTNKTSPEAGDKYSFFFSLASLYLLLILTSNHDFAFLCSHLSLPFKNCFLFFLLREMNIERTASILDRLL